MSGSRTEPGGEGPLLRGVALLAALAVGGYLAVASTPLSGSAGLRWGVVGLSGAVALYALLGLAGLHERTWLGTLVWGLFEGKKLE